MGNGGSADPRVSQESVRRIIDGMKAVIGDLENIERAVTESDRNGGAELLPRIRSFILGHLGDPRLDPASVAAAHHISVRSLHRLFQSQGLTVVGFIRHQRLEGVRRDLTDPGLRGKPIHAVAARWGFPRAAEFTRAFRASYGVTPSDYRESASAT